MDSMNPLRIPPKLSLASQRFQLAIACSEVNGRPSTGALKVIPSRNVKVQVSPSSLVVQLSTREGWGVRVSSNSKSFS